jgi:hypothetical protein
VLTARAILRGEHEIDGGLLEQLDVEEVLGAAATIEKGHRDVRLPECVSERRKGCEPHPSGNHPRLGARLHKGKRASQGPQTGDVLSIMRGEQLVGRDPDTLVE